MRSCGSHTKPIQVRRGPDRGFAQAACIGSRFQDSPKGNRWFCISAIEVRDFALLQDGRFELWWFRFGNPRPGPCAWSTCTSCHCHTARLSAPHATSHPRGIDVAARTNRLNGFFSAWYRAVHRDQHMGAGSASRTPRHATPRPPCHSTPCHSTPRQFKPRPRKE